MPANPRQYWGVAKIVPRKCQSRGRPSLGGMMHPIVLETVKNSGFDVTYVPYTGGGPTNMALLGGHIDYRVAQPPDVYRNSR